MSSQGPNPNIRSPRLVKELVEWGKLRSSRLDSELLCAHVLSGDRLALYTHGDDIVSDQNVKRFQDLIARRQQGEPVAYLTGIKEFFCHEFIVNKSVLIPRPDTEKLVETALLNLPENQKAKVIDLCTGSGCVAISIALARPLASVMATDVSEAALKVARLNAHRHGVAERVEFRLGSWLEPVKQERDVDLIVANPPYIKRSAEKMLAVDVINFEPHLALFGNGESGLDGHFEIIREAPKLLKNGASLILEIGYDQRSELEGHCFDKFAPIRFVQDDAGHDRVVVLKWIN